MLFAGKAQPCREESHAGLLCSLDDTLALGTQKVWCHVGPCWTPITSKSSQSFWVESSMWIGCRVSPGWAIHHFLLIREHPKLDDAYDHDEPLSWMNQLL